MRRWLVPATAMAMLVWTALSGQDAALFLSMNSSAAALPDAWWSCVTVLGDTLVALTLALPLVRSRPSWVMSALLASIPATIITHGLKHWVPALRPAAVLGDAVHVVGPTLHHGSFPSGHTTTAFVLAAVAMAGLRFSAPSFLVAATALLVGISRIAVGAHWPLDVAAGMLIGWASGMAGVHVAQTRQMGSNPRSMVAVHVLLVGCAVWLLVGHDSRYPLALVFEKALAVGALALYLWPLWSNRDTVNAVTPATRAQPD